MQSLHRLLRNHKAEQAAFMRQRLERALPRMLASLPDAAMRAHIRNQFTRVAAAPMGTYALMDYVNFKGEGSDPLERYGGQGWGLLQVLARMRGDQPGIAAVREFAATANQLLTERVAHAPPERHEARWLPGWRKRLKSYPREAERALIEQTKNKRAQHQPAQTPCAQAGCAHAGYRHD